MTGVFDKLSKMAEWEQRERNISNGHHLRSSSPLKLFGMAKKKINDVYKSITEYVVDNENFLKDISTRTSLQTQNYRDIIKGFHSKVDGITEVLSRDHMKVVFFGRTSNGKSTCINAMLKNKILPSGIGHTTNCFLQVEGTDQSEAFVLTENSTEKQNIKNIKQLAHALSSYKLSSNSLIRILWPKEKCRLLKEDVVLTDSPGIDVTPDLDLWIDKFCLDADVFVLVANSESTLMQTEKNFFHKVSERLSKPNVFVLMNRWDMSAHEEDVDKVKEQHLQRNIQFLVDELKVADASEVENRIFFISAREAMVCRSNADQGTSTPVTSLADGFQDRLFEFTSFETQFETCISKSAVKTKFEQHTECGKYITSESRAIMDEICTKILTLKNEKNEGKNEKQKELQYTDDQLLQWTGSFQKSIKSLSDDVERQVSQSLRDEINRLAYIVEEFKHPFGEDHKNLSDYKRELHAHLEKSLEVKLHSRCSLALLRLIHNLHRDMTDKLGCLIPQDSKQHLLQITSQSFDFELTYHLNCESLCSDFIEDLEFRFSFGIPTIMSRILGSPLTKQNIFRTSTGQYGRRMCDHFMNLIPKASSLSPASASSVLVAFLVARSAGWRVLVITGGLYGLVYLFEKLMWTSRAKENALKKQYTAYAASKLKLIVDLTSSNCGHQVKSELMSSLNQLSSHITAGKDQISNEIQQLDSEIHSLSEIGSRARILRNKADWIDGELNGFINQFLSDKE